MPFDSCSVCSLTNKEREEVEETGVLALRRDISWREAGRRLTHLGFTHPNGIKNHMEKHFEPAGKKALEVLEDDLTQKIADTKRVLLDSIDTAPPLAKGLYIAAIRNLDAIMETKPSQKDLIQALKTIQELTGMRLEQQMLLQFAQAAFGASEEEAAGALPEARPNELERFGEVLDAEVVE